MPYQDPERRRQAARKWRLSHRAQRAEYMRRYRKAHRSGRPPGRPRFRDVPSTEASPATDWPRRDPSDPTTRTEGPRSAGRPVPPVPHEPADLPPDDPRPSRGSDDLPTGPSAAPTWTEDPGRWGP